jgi:hypothetical protein
VSELITQTARLVPYAKRPKQSGGFVTAYIYEPMADDPGAKLGSFYVVLEVLVSGRASEEVADLIIETVGEHYYNRPLAENQTLADRFENAIKAANVELGEHVNRGNAAWIGKLSAVIAVQSGAELHIAHTGSAEAFLYRGHSATRITDSSPNRPATPTKTFGSIATGQLEAGDHILLSTPALVHQVPLPRLQSIIGGSSPNTSIAEVTTPELAALRVRSETPAEIQLGTPETPLASAKMAAAPIAKTTTRSGKMVAGAALSAVKKARPHARRLSLTLVDCLRQGLATKKGRYLALVLVALMALAALGVMSLSYQNRRSAALVNRYKSAYSNYLKAQQQFGAGNKPDAQAAAQTAHKQIAELKPSQHALDAELAKNQSLKSNEPRSLAGLDSQLNNLINEISGLNVVKTTTLATLPSSAGSPEHFEIYMGKAYIFDSSPSTHPSIVNITNGATVKSKADASNIGVVKYTSISSDNTGIYLLTDKPGVWLYRFSTDTISPITTAFGQWPAGSAIVSYLSNLYLLSDGVVYKYPKTAVGFSPPVKSLSLSNPGTSTNALAVDGSIYTAGSSQLLRYNSGKLVSSTDLPTGLGPLSIIRSTGNSSRLVATSTESNRIAVWAIGNSSLSLVGQIELHGVSKLFDATYNSQTGTYYATADHKLVSFQLDQ